MATERPDLVSVLMQSKTKMELLEPWELLNPLQMQTEIDINMRIALAEWMMEVCCDLNLEPEVFCLAVSCLDRFLCKVSLKRTQLQLLGVSCLLVAWKVRGEREVNIESLLKLTADSIFKEEILECEMLVLTKLNWNLPSLVAVDFLHQILQKVDSKLPHQHVKDSAVSLIQSCYIHPSLAVRPPQLLSAAAVVSIIRPTLAKSDMAADTLPPSTSSSHSTSHTSSIPTSSYMSSSPLSSTSPTSSPPSSSSYLSSSPCSSSFDSSSPSSFIQAFKRPYITPSSDLPTYITENPSSSDLSTSMTENPLSSDLPSYITEKPSPSELPSYVSKNTPTFGTTYSQPTNLNSTLLIQSSTKSQDIPVRGEGKHSKRKSTKLDKLIRSIQRVTLSDKTSLQGLIEDIQNLVILPLESRNLLNLTPSPESRKCTTPGKKNGSDSTYLYKARNLFPDISTPTKVLDASQFSNS